MGIEFLFGWYFGPHKNINPCHRTHFLCLRYAQIAFAVNPTGGRGAYSVPSLRLLAGFVEPLCGREGREGRGEKREEKGWERRDGMRWDGMGVPEIHFSLYAPAHD